MMLQKGSGHIVAMCSMCGIYGVSQKVAYCSSKFAVKGITYQRVIISYNMTYLPVKV